MSDASKRCFNCGLRKEVINFGYRAEAKDKLKTYCLECSQKEERPVEAGQKQCSMCARHLLYTDFTPDARKRDGLMSSCKSCLNRIHRKAIKKKQIILNEFKSKGCCRCPATDIRIMEVDHIQRGTKARYPSGKPILIMNLSIRKLKRELNEYCQSLCTW